MKTRVCIIVAACLAVLVGCKAFFGGDAEIQADRSLVASINQSVADEIALYDRQIVEAIAQGREAEAQRMRQKRDALLKAQQYGQVIDLRLQDATKPDGSLDLPAAIVQTSHMIPGTAGLVVGLAGTVLGVVYKVRDSRSAAQKAETKKAMTSLVRGIDLIRQDDPAFAATMKEWAKELRGVYTPLANEIVEAESAKIVVAGK